MYILVMLVYGNFLTIHNINFSSRKTCEVAQHNVRMRDANVKTFCVEK